MPWLTIITTVLSLVGNLVTWLNNQRLLDAGADAEIARQTLKVLELTQQGKELVDKIHRMSDDELNNFLKELGK